MSKPPYTREDATNTWESIKDTPPRDPPNGVYRDRENLDDDLSLHERIVRVLAALAKANDPEHYGPHIYVRGGRLVQVHIDEDQRPSIKVLQMGALRDEISRVAKFVGKVYPPDAIVSGVLAAAQYAGVPGLKGITEVPVLRPDGTILDTEGYDRSTGMIYRKVAEAAAIPKIAQFPTNEQVADALALVWNAIGDFPFEMPADRANALGLLLTLVLRAAVDGRVPLSLIDATRAGTGKTLLAEVVALIGVGHHRGMLTEAESEGEWRKRITATLLAGHPLNIIDNLSLPLRSAALSSALTSEVWADRQLGKNLELNIVSNAIWVATGNNIRVAGDLPRRTYRIRLDAKSAQPWTRTGFQHPDLLAWIKKRRPDLVHALLTIA